MNIPTTKTARKILDIIADNSGWIKWDHVESHLNSGEKSHAFNYKLKYTEAGILKDDYDSDDDLTVAFTAKGAAMWRKGLL